MLFYMLRTHLPWRNALFGFNVILKKTFSGAARFHVFLSVQNLYEHFGHPVFIIHAQILFCVLRTNQKFIAASNRLFLDHNVIFKSLFKHA